MDNIDEEIDFKTEDNDIKLYGLSKPDLVDNNFIKMETIYPADSAIVYHSKDLNTTDTASNKESISVEHVKQENVSEGNGTSSDKKLEQAKKLQENGYRCFTCGYQTRLKLYLKLHQRRHLPLEERRLFGCAHCDNKYVTKAALIYHLQYNHIDPRAKELKKSQEKVYICAICNYQTSDKPNFNKHAKVHLAPEKREMFACEQCDKKYMSKSRLQFHMQRHHNATRTKVFRAKKVKKVPKKIYTCTTCIYESRHMSKLRQHKKTHLAREQRQLFACAHCAKKYLTNRSLKDHVKDNHTDSSIEAARRVYRCTICSYQTPHQSNLSQHKKIHLAPEKREVFGCAQCDKKYVNKGVLKLHLSRGHSVSRSKKFEESKKKVCRYKCSRCGYQTPHMSDFRKHKAVHLAPEERQLFVCAHCDKKYKNKTSLRRHLKRSHIYSRNADCLTVTNEGKSEDCLKIKIDEDAPILNKNMHDDFKNTNCISLTDEIISEDSIKIEIDDHVPLLDNFKNAEYISVSNKVKSEDFLKIENDDAPILNKDMHDNFKNSEKFSVTKKLKF